MAWLRVCRSRGFGRTIAVTALASLLFAPIFGGATAQADEPARQNGDLFVGGASFVDGYGSTAGGIWRVRGTTPTLFCASPISSGDPGFWNEPRSLIVDSLGRIVFLADIGGQNIGLLRCDKPGDPAERLGLLRVRTGTPEGWPEPFPGTFFGSRMGSLHILTERAVTDDLQSAPKVTTEDSYEFVVQTRADPGDPSVPGTTQLVRYGADSHQWLTGADLPGIVQSGNLVSVIAHGDSLYSFNGSVLRRTSMPLKLSLAGTAGGVDFRLTYTPFGGVHEFSGITDDTSVPNVSSGCNTDPPGKHDNVTDLMPWQGGFAPLSGDQVSYDEHGDLGLVIRTSYGPMPGPYMTHVSSALLNDDPSDDEQGYFHQPFDNCRHVPWIQFSSILPSTSPGSTVAFDNVMDTIATAPGGMVGTSFWGNVVARLTPGDKVTRIVELYHPTAIAAYPAIVPQLGTVVYITVHSPVDVLLTDAAGRAIGVDPATGVAVNDFGIGGFDSGPGEPRVFAIKNPAPGPFHVQSVGTGSGPYRIDVSSADLSTGVTSRIQTSGTASVGAIADRDFVLSPAGGLSFVGGSNDTTAPTTSAVQTPLANGAGWNNGNVTVSLSSADEAGGSGIKELAYSATGAQPIAATSVAGSTASISVAAEGETIISYFGTDNAGNAEAAKTLTVKIDRTNPTISGAVAPAANAAGWNKEDVLVTFSCGDGGSGVASCSSVARLSTEGAGLSATGAASDRAGNTSSVTLSGINIDKTAPHTSLSQSPAANAAGWNRGPVTLTFAATDGLSGVASTDLSIDGAAFGPYVTAVTLSAEGTHTLRYRSTDRAGNVEAEQTLTIRIDRTAPEASVGFDLLTGDIAVTGFDALSGVPAGALAPTVSASARDSVTRRTYVVADRAGNTLGLVIDVTRERGALKATVVGLSYDGAAATTVSRNRLSFEWELQDGTVRRLEQEMQIGRGDSGIELQAEYGSKTDVTRISIEDRGLERHVVKPGLVFVRMTTDRGGLLIDY